ncbi:TRAP transporter small permease [Cohaesibacter celericrescens]|uniref:TRAP transporter small permease protein n=1 Tax=Cohaesibacter celericrescens TaxID=2067669 RepID=A0A2N5XRF9_9HYPH|nr:TRAP transporter small permease [Cohaesibacter celericrescens]PLW77106.1 hypothetical protein C0081_11160 [Cohaesibacter celericrescens]
MTGLASANQEHPVLRLEQMLLRGLKMLLTVVFALIFALVTLLVILRYGFNTTIVGGSEATVMLFIYTTCIGASVDIARGKHIRIDALIGLLPSRIQNWLEGFILLLIGVLHCMLFVYSMEWISIVGNSEDPILHIPEGIVEIAIPIGCFFAILFCVTRLTALVLTSCSDPSNNAA